MQMNFYMSSSAEKSWVQAGLRVPSRPRYDYSAVRTLRLHLLEVVE